MQLLDVKILTQKIVIGIIIFLVPLVILAGGLWFIQHAAH
jgi:hypothetical protein